MELDVYNFKGPGVALSMYNVEEVYISSAQETKAKLFMISNDLIILYFISPFALLLSHLWQWHLGKNGLSI